MNCILEKRREGQMKSFIIISQELGSGGADLALGWGKSAVSSLPRHPCPMRQVRSIPDIPNTSLNWLMWSTTIYY